MVLTFTSGHKIPKIIKKLNKAVGLPKNSKDFWNIIDVANNTADIGKNAGLISGNTAYINTINQNVGLTSSTWFDAIRLVKLNT